MKDHKKTIVLTGFMIIVLAIFGVVMAEELKLSDFPQHIAWAKEYGEVGYLYRIPHTLFSKLVVIIRALLPANILIRVSVLAKQVFDLKSYEISAWILMLLSYGATAWILVKRIASEWRKDKINVPQWAAPLAVLALLMVGPIFLFTFPDRMYLGYISPNPYHNPTYVLFRPFVLLILFNAIDNLRAKWDWKQSALMAFWILCATLAKPNFTLTIVPAIGLMVVYFFLKKLKPVNWFYVIGPVGLTALIVLLSQFIINYAGERGDQLIFAPFTVILKYVPNVPLAILFLLLSILFPLVVSILFWKTTSTRLSFQLVFVNFLVSLVYGYFIAERINLSSNNFGWGMMIAVFLWFGETLIVFGQQLFNRQNGVALKSWKILVPGGALLLHLVCGVIYYISTLTIPTVLVP